jgi:nitric oxide reductase NorD protein
VWEVGRPGESWNRVAARLGGLEPRGYTRIGPALRHATQRLSRRHAERRLLVLLSDGKPTDYDRYEGRYGIADIRRAVQEATAGGVHLHALAIDGTARAHLPSQFGTGCWSVLPCVDDLPETLAGMYARLTAS